MMRLRFVRLMAILIVAGMLGAVTTLDSAAKAGQAASDRYTLARNALLKDVQAARNEGFSAADLADISNTLTTLDAAPAPSLGGDVGAFYLAHASAASELDLELGDRKLRILAGTTADTRAAMQKATADVARVQDVGALDVDLLPLHQRLAAADRLLASAKTLADWRTADSEMTLLANDAAALAARQQAENAAIQQASVSLTAQTSGNIDSIRKVGTDAQANGRNDASVAAYEALPGRFKNIGPLMDLYNRMESYGAKLGSGDVNTVLLGSAAVQRYAGQLHQLMVQGLSHKHLIVNFATQHFWAFENGNVVSESATTTGVRGVTAYGTDFGPMKILYRSHPWKMHSPFPKGTPHWYPDTVVQWTAFFTWSGESFHDSYWEPDSQLGPGSQYNTYTRSHGCVHVPYGNALFLFNWASEGTPVDVFPGNGQPVSEQLSEMTTDNQGNPLNPA